MTKSWTVGFQSGILWAAARLVDRHDRPDLAADLCKQAGMALRDLAKADVADQEAINKIIAEWGNCEAAALSTTPDPDLQANSGLPPGGSQ